MPRNATEVRTAPHFAWRWVWWWTLAFLANMPLVVIFGGGLARNGGAAGLIGGLGFLYLLGATVCGLRWPVGRSLVSGGWIIAATQIVPVLQFGSILLAVWTTDSVTGAKRFGNSIDTYRTVEVTVNFQIGAVVILAAQPQVVLALFLGAAVRRRCGDLPIWFSRPADLDAESLSPPENQQSPPLPAGERWG